MEDNPNTMDEPGQVNDPEAPARREPITEERIAERAFLISQSDRAGTAEENWLRAERELREEQELEG